MNTELITQLNTILAAASKEAGIPTGDMAPGISGRVLAIRDYLGDLLREVESLDSDADTVADNMDRVDSEVKDLASEIREIGDASISDAHHYIDNAENTCESIDVDWQEARVLRDDIQSLCEGLNVLYGRLDDLVDSLPPVSDEETPNAANPQTEEVQA
tara:strand:- start:18024 stop:18500 length:477 start_codon:yes stop_codon:yes gene_type:complete